MAGPRVTAAVAFVSPPEFWPLVGWDTAAFACLLGLWTTACAAAQRSVTSLVALGLRLPGRRAVWCVP